MKFKSKLFQIILKSPVIIKSDIFINWISYKMASCIENTTGYWEDMEKTLVESVVKQIDSEKLLHDLDTAVDNAESHLNKVNDLENVGLYSVANYNLTTSSMLFTSLLENSVFERQKSDTKHGEVKLNNVTSEEVMNESCTITLSSTLVENNVDKAVDVYINSDTANHTSSISTSSSILHENNQLQDIFDTVNIISSDAKNLNSTNTSSSKLVGNQLEETMYNSLPNFTSTPIKNKLICDKNENARNELQGMSLYEPTKDLHFPQIVSTQCDNIFTNDYGYSKLMKTIQNIGDLNNGNDIKCKINKSNKTLKGKHHQLGKRMNKVKSKISTHSKLNDKNLIKMGNKLNTENIKSINEVENILMNKEDNELINTINEMDTIIENNNTIIQKNDDEIKTANNLYRSKDSPLQNNLKNTSSCKMDMVKMDKVNSGEINKDRKNFIKPVENLDIELQEKVDEAEMHCNVSDLKIDLPLDENEQEDKLKRPALEVISNDGKKIKLNQIKSENLVKDASFAQDVTLENFTRLIFESQKTIDENDPNWRNIHDMSTAEDYFQFVTYQWQSTDLPEPHTNLSKIFVPRPESLQFMQNPKTCRTETKALVQQAKKNARKTNKLNKSRSEYTLINKFYYKENGEQKIQYLNKPQFEDFRLQERILEFQHKFYK